MNIRQFIQTQKTNHTERRSHQIQQAMQDNKAKLARAEKELAYRQAKEKLRQTKKASRELRTKPMRELGGQAKSIMNKIQGMKKPKARSSSSGPRTIKIVIPEPKQEQKKEQSVWRV